MDDEDIKTLLARVDERTRNIMVTLEKLASHERVDALEGRLARHVESHDKKGGIVATWAGIVAAAGIGLAGLFRGSAP